MPNKMEAFVKAYQTDRVYSVPAGMPLSVWEDKYARRKADGTFQSWEERLREVVLGNFLLSPQPTRDFDDLEPTLDLALKGVMAFSGRHLQHGDALQPTRNMELFTNCSTAVFCFTSFWLLLNGSGVGADYSSYTRRINFAKCMPHIRLVLDAGSDDRGEMANGAHPDFKAAEHEFHGCFETKRDATHKYPPNSEAVRWFEVDDSREGWVKIIEILETAAWQEKHGDKIFIFDFSKVRPAGAPIRGVQDRPASGPLPVMRSLAKVANLKGMVQMPPWKQALFIDHFISTCVQLGGVRRSARMATKWWRDPDVFDFIEVKRGGFLWTANISIVVDEEFWEQVTDPRSHAWRVFQAATAAQYYDKTGEPGFINVHRMNRNADGVEKIEPETYINPHCKLQIHPRTKDMMGKILGYIKEMAYPFIVNPCGEVVLAIWGGYCVIADICLALARSLNEVIEACRLTPKALIRVNLMNALYEAEVKRTNRIGVSLTGIHEFAARFFQVNFRDMVNAYQSVSPFYAITTEARTRAKQFWEFIATMSATVMESADDYSDDLDVVHPHTYTTIKPSGTVGKVMNCTEGAHLPAMAYYMRWVQFPKSVHGAPNPAIAQFMDAGYPTKDVSHQYHNMMVVGFPTTQPLVQILGSDVVTAGDATPLEQFEWIRLLETFWFGSKDGVPQNNQVSYTMKYRQEDVTYADYMEILKAGLPTVRCCAIDPIKDLSAYAYQPEEALTEAEYKQAIGAIAAKLEREIYDDDLLSCAGGVCAVDASINLP